MTNSSTHKPPVWFWIVSVLALLWNGVGVNAYLQQAYDTEGYREAYTAEQLEIAASAPAWITAVFAIAVFSAFIACILLLVRKKFATLLFIISLIAVVVQMGYGFATGSVISIGISVSTVIVALILVWFSRHATQKSWLN